MSSSAVNPASDAGCGSVVSHNDLLIVPAYEGLLRSNQLDSLDALFSVSDAESLTKPGLGPWRQRLRLTLNVSGSGRTFYLKRFANPPASVRREVRRAGYDAKSVAGLEWTWMHRLAGEGIPCVKPVAFGEDLHGSRERRSAILTAAVPGDSLERFADRWGDSDRGTVRRLIPPLAKLVARLHGRGYIHRDLYLSHVFYDPTTGVEKSLCLIDLQRVIRPRWGRRRWIVKDLASLNYSAPGHLVSRTDRIRWLKHYLALPKLDASARRLAHRVVGKTKRIAKHDRRRTARLQTQGGSQ